MKKTKLLVTGLFICLACSSCGTIESLDNYKTISFAASQEKIAANDTFVFFGGMEECSACSTLKETLYDYLKDNVYREIYYMDVVSLSNDELVAQRDIAYNFLGADYYTSTNHNPAVFYTPTIFRYDEGRLADVNIGAMSNVESLLRTNYRELSYEQYVTHSSDISTGYYYFHPALSNEYETEVVTFLDDNPTSILYSIEWDEMDNTEISQVYALANIDYATATDIPSNVIVKYESGVMSNTYTAREDLATIFNIQ